jgi:hypothetical protein
MFNLGGSKATTAAHTLALLESNNIHTAQNEVADMLTKQQSERLLAAIIFVLLCFFVPSFFAHLFK